MTNSNTRQQRLKMISAAGDKIVETTGIGPSEVSGYAISHAAFGKKPNGDFYILHDLWLKERQAVPGAPPVDMPPHAVAELEGWADHFKVEIMQRVTAIVRSIAVAFDQTTSLRVTALERFCADHAREKRAVIETLVETEAELDEARKDKRGLEGDVQTLRNAVQRLLGRIEQLTGDAATADSAAVAIDAATSDPAGDGERTLLDVIAESAPPADSADADAVAVSDAG